MDDYTDSLTFGLCGSGVDVTNDPFNASSGSRYLISFPFKYGGCLQMCVQWSTGKLAIRSRENNDDAFREWTYLP